MEHTQRLAQRERITALDLAGDEARFPAEWFRDHFCIARESGWHVTVHAGEIAGPATGRLGAWRMVFRRADDFLERRRSRHSASKDKSLAAHVDYGNYCDAAIQG